MVRQRDTKWLERERMVGVEYKKWLERGRMVGQGDTKWLERGRGWLDREIQNG